jgi:aryl-alcohol dehydrogenase (NADP+)
MKYTTLGNSGLVVSRICLGGNSWGSAGRRAWAAMDAAASQPFFRRALDVGINFFDTADVYNLGASEEAIGAHLVGAVPRDELVLCTKVGLPMGPKPNQAGLGRKHVMASIDASLKRLRTDHVDLYMLHRYDPATPAEEIVSTLADIVRAGKARHVAASTMRATQLARMQCFARANGLPLFVSMQNLYNLLDRSEEADMIPFCIEEGIALTPYSPLARGVLSGNRGPGANTQTERAREDKMAAPYMTEAAEAVVGKLRTVAAAIGAMPSQVALAWLLHQTGLAAPVVGVTRLDQIDDAAKATELSLDAAQLAALSG